MKFPTIITASAIATAALLAEQADAHAFLMKPAIQLTTNDKNMYAYVVPGEKVPPFSSYTTGNAESNSKGFVTNYQKLKPASLKSFIMANQVRATSGVPAGGTAECGYSNMNQPALPLPDAIEFGNYQLSNREGIHPGPCEAWCDDDIVVPFTMDCRTILNKPITYDKAKCQGKKRLTFYWLATHFAPFQVYIGCAPLSGGGGGASGGSAQNNNGGAAGGGAGGAGGGQSNTGGGQTGKSTGQNNNGGQNNGAQNNNGNRPVGSGAPGGTQNNNNNKILGSGAPGGGQNSNNNNRNGNGNGNGNTGNGKARSMDFSDSGGQSNGNNDGGNGPVRSLNFGDLGNNFKFFRHH